MPDLPDKPASLTAHDKAALDAFFRRQSAGELRLCSLEYGHGRPGKPFAKCGVIWPTQQQAEMFKP